MALSRRQKLTVISLLVYWPGVFILAHMPIPELVYKARVSDKSLHFLVYLILTFLLWFAISPDKKVSWRKATAWLVLLVVVWYGAVDEVLQSYVGRNCDAKDFFADLMGTLTGLLLFSFFNFWPVLLIVTGINIFALTNLAKANLAELVPITNAMFHLFAYGFFTMLWLQCIHLFLSMKPPKLEWVVTALLPPVCFLLIVKSFSMILDKDLDIKDMIVAVAAITGIVAALYFNALLRAVFLKNRQSNIS
ncbi:MAG: VanZ family protein [Phycisphaerae bacterium]|nr:VanZ family protein [Phycisphaerae bacterium]